MLQDVIAIYVIIGVAFALTGLLTNIDARWDGSIWQNILSICILCVIYGIFWVFIVFQRGSTPPDYPENTDLPEDPTGTT